jgi:hypothetical protein
MNEYMNEQQSEGIEEVTDQKVTETTFEIDLTDKPKEIIPKETEEVEQTPEPPKRAAWGNRFSFIISAVGASVGFGNFLRFPYLAFQQGGLKMFYFLKIGGAFLIPFIVSILLIGDKILLLELSVGQLLQKTAIKAFQTLNK